MNSNITNYVTAFEYRHFIVGGHTADFAYDLLYAKELELESKIQSREVELLERECRIAAANEVLKRWKFWTSESKRLKAKADIRREYIGLEIQDMNYAALKKEAQSVSNLLRKLKPYCKYLNLDRALRQEIVAREEFLLQYKMHLENVIVSQQGLSAEDIKMVRRHPDFETELIPHIGSLHDRLEAIRTYTRTALDRAKDNMALLIKPTLFAEPEENSNLPSQ